MSKGKVPTGQLSLWEEEVQPADATEKWYTLDEIIVRRERWADEEYGARAKALQTQGLSLAEIAAQMDYREYTVTNWLTSNSTSSEQQERLALAVLGDLDSSFIGNDGMKHFYRCIATSIVNGEVLAAYEYERPVLSRPAMEDDEID